MKLIRILLNCLALALLLAVILILAAFVPILQTWAVQLALLTKPGLHGSVGSVSAGFGEVELDDVRLESDGAVLTVPSFDVQLPLVTALRSRKYLVQSLVAKGWTLDLSHASAPGAAGDQPAARPAGAGGKPDPSQVLSAFLALGRVPADGSLDGVDLDGEVVLPRPGLKTTARVHFTLKGGGLAPGRTGAFAVDLASSDPDLPLDPLDVNGDLKVTEDPDHRVERLELQAALSAPESPLPSDLRVGVTVAAAPDPADSVATVTLSRGGRPVATLSGRLAAATRAAAGTWKLNARDADLTPFLPNRPVPTFTATGAGTFDLDTDLNRIHAAGALQGEADHWGTLVPELEQVGATPLALQFDVTARGAVLQVDQISGELRAVHPAIRVTARQPFTLNLATGKLALPASGHDWLTGTIQGVPLAWLSSVASAITLSGSDAAAAFAVQTAPAGFAVRLTQPLTVTGVSVALTGRTLARGVDLSLPLTAQYGPAGLTADLAPLVISSAGQHLATLAVHVTQAPGGDQPLAVTGKGTADLAALGAQPADRGLRWLTGRSATGEFTAQVGATATCDGKLTAIGGDPDHTVTASGHLDLSADGTLSFRVPVKVAVGSGASEVVAEGTVASAATGGRVDLTVTGGTVSLAHLRLLAAPLALAGGVPWPMPLTAGTVRDRTPFWGSWTGTISVGIDRLLAHGREFGDVGGTLEVDPQSLRLTGSRAALPPRSHGELAGTIAFDPNAPYPYRLNATGSLDKVEATAVLPLPAPGDDPLIEGRFDVTGTMAGDGITAIDLLRRSSETFHITSKTGIVRLLKTNVGEAVPQVATPMKDALGDVGSVFGAILGRPHDDVGEGKNPVSKQAEAVLDFTDQVSEFGCDDITIDAQRGADGTIRLGSIALTARDEHLTGSGTIAAGSGQPLQQRPLSVDLQFGARERVAALLATAGLLSGQQDGLGYKLLNQPVHFGGTLDHVDTRAWHDLLAKAVSGPPAPPKKGS